MEKNKYQVNDSCSLSIFIIGYEYIKWDDVKYYFDLNINFLDINNLFEIIIFRIYFI